MAKQEREEIRALVGELFARSDGRAAINYDTNPATYIFSNLTVDAVTDQIESIKLVQQPNTLLEQAQQGA